MSSAVFSFVNHLNPSVPKEFLFVNGLRARPVGLHAHAHHHARGPGRVVRAHVSRVQQRKDAQVEVALNETGSRGVGGRSVKGHAWGGEERGET